MTLKGQRSQLL